MKVVKISHGRPIVFRDEDPCVAKQQSHCIFIFSSIVGLGQSMMCAIERETLKRCALSCVTCDKSFTSRYCMTYVGMYIVRTA